MFTNYLVMFSFRSLTKILVGDLLQLRSFEAFPNRDHDMLNKGVVWIEFGSSRLEDVFIKKTSVPSLVLCLDPFVKIRIV